MKNLLLLLALCSFFFCRAQTPTVKWYYDIKDAAFGQTAAADIDNDGKLELVFSTYRNDSNMYVLNAENGSLKWKYNVGGSADAAPLIFDVDKDGDLEIILAGSCNPKTFCFDADSGYTQWVSPMRGSDSPPSIGDVDGDGVLEVIHGEFDGYVICFNAKTGAKKWEIKVANNGWVQTDPALYDFDKNGILDFVVGTWEFSNGQNKVACYRGDNQVQMWQSLLPDDVMYHGAAFGDMDKDGKAELTFGDYEANVFCLNAESGSVNWRDSFPTVSNYIGAPTTLADLNKDGFLDVVICDAYHIRAKKHNGDSLWNYTIPNYGTAFRGVAIADINNDNVLDVTFGTSEGMVISLNGQTGALIKSIDLAAHIGKADFDIDHAPIIADFDKDGVMDVFIVGGHAEYPNVQNNYGRAYAISWGVGKGPDWTMFRRDEKRSACLCDANLLPLNLDDVAAENVNGVVLYPNPNKGSFELRFHSKRNTSAVVQVTDMLGRKVMADRHEQASTGANTVFVRTNGFAPGIFTVTLAIDSEKYSQLMRLE